MSIPASPVEFIGVLTVLEWQDLFTTLDSSCLWYWESSGDLNLCCGVLNHFGTFSARFSLFPPRVPGAFMLGVPVSRSLSSHRSVALTLLPVPF